jgi:uncharacterized membrane protein YhaH (DUF805 family)
MNYYLSVLKKYAVFGGRARRKEYWMFALISGVISIMLSIIDMAVLGSNVLSIVYAVAVLLPSLAVSVRRLHDTGRSGGWIFIALIPFVGFIILLVFTATDGQRQDNQYGPDPKLVPAA